MTDHCCTPDSGDCCGPGSWCCGKAGKHDHEETRMTTNHIDQMRAWWDEATPGIPKTGDTYIEDERHRGSSFRIVEAATDHKYGFDNIRILSRAPEPRPAWLNAPAVQAWHRNDHRTEHDGTPGKPRIWSPDYGTTETWSTPSLPSVHWSELVDVVPLVHWSELVDVVPLADTGTDVGEQS